MCLQVVERYAVCKYDSTGILPLISGRWARSTLGPVFDWPADECHSRCLYHRHAVDVCGYFGQRGHVPTEKTVYVGYTCPTHSTQQTHCPCAPSRLSDSGYASGSYQ